MTTKLEQALTELTYCERAEVELIATDVQRCADGILTRREALERALLVLERERG